MLLFGKLVYETQMVKTPEPTSQDNFKKHFILLPLRAIYFRSLYYETPCSKVVPAKIVQKLHGDPLETLPHCTAAVKAVGGSSDDFRRNKIAEPNGTI